MEVLTMPAAVPCAKPDDPIALLHAQAKQAFLKLSRADRANVLLAFKNLDGDNSGGVTRCEVEQRLRDPGTRSLALCYFDTLDKDGSGTLDFWEMVTLAHLLRNPAKLCGVCCSILLRGAHCSVCDTYN